MKIGRSYYVLDREAFLARRMDDYLLHAGYRAAVAAPSLRVYRRGYVLGALFGLAPWGRRVTLIAQINQMTQRTAEVRVDLDVETKGATVSAREQRFWERELKGLEAVVQGGVESGLAAQTGTRPPALGWRMAATAILLSALGLALAVALLAGQFRAAAAATALTVGLGSAVLWTRRGRSGPRQEVRTMTAVTDMEQIEGCMRPGRLSAKGFLGQDESLADVIARDDATLRRLGISHEQIANALEELLAAAERLEEGMPWSERDAHSTDFPNLYQPETVPAFDLAHLPPLDQGILVGHWQVFWLRWRGLQDCPWGCGLTTTPGAIDWVSQELRWAFFDFMIVNRRTGDTVTGPGLIVHLIRRHRFFEGLHSPYRADPVRLIRVLELRPDPLWADGRQRQESAVPASAESLEGRRDLLRRAADAAHLAP